MEIRITAKVNLGWEEFQELRRRVFGRRNIFAKSVKGGIIFHLPELLSYNHYQLPPEIRDNAILSIDVAESGGREECGSLIVCLDSGKPIRPFYVPRGRDLVSCGKHAFFSVHGSVVTVAAYSGSPEVMIEEHRIFLGGNDTAQIDSDIIFMGYISSFPEKLKRFYAAVKAANEKAHCPNCRHVHYAIIGEQ